MVNEEKVINRFNIQNGTYERVYNFEKQDPLNLKIVGNDIFFLERNDSGYKKLCKRSI